MKSINWYCVNRNELPEALFAIEPVKSLGGIPIDLDVTEPTEVAFGYSSEDSAPNFPSLLVLQDSKMAEVFAWLKAYAPETSPLSQFARVISYSDFKLFRSNTSNDSIYWDRVDRWSSVILGEILSHGDSDTTLDKLPLSRGQATFTMAVAKSAIIYANKEITDTCIERLRVLETDPKFVHRSVSVFNLLPIWKNVSIKIDESSSFTQSFNQILFDSPLDLFHGAVDSSCDWRSYSEFLSDSVEKRVLTFQHLESKIKNSDFSKDAQSQLAASLAMGAFLVGRSTSHAFLLKDSAKELPAVYAWFGLIAGIFGPTFWDVHWSRAAKGIEKGLRNKFDWMEPTSSDLSWTEFIWLSKAHRTALIFGELPKMLPKVLSLEVVPGAVCQFRLNSGDSNSKEIDRGIEKNTFSDYQMREVRDNLFSLLDLAEKTIKSLGEAPAHEVQFDNTRNSLKKSSAKVKSNKNEKKI